MSSFLRFAPFFLILGLVVSAAADEAPADEAAPGEEVAWSKDLTVAFQEAKAARKILMICVNAKKVTGGTREEPAAKGLREVVYKDPRVVAKSRAFVCAFLTPQGTADEYGELRALGIEGRIVSPQHIFVHPDGNRILLREPYWSHGPLEPGVTAFLALMDKAEAAFKADAGGGGASPAGGDEGADDAPGPVGSPERAAWIEAKIQRVLGGRADWRNEALRKLVTHDADGDCTTPLIALMGEHEKDVPLLVDLIRALGHDGLLTAAPGIAAHLTRKEDLLRGNAAVSLEHIGGHEKGVISALKKAVGKEKDPAIANHMYRALGRLGVEDSKIRSLLLKKCDSAKSEFASYGPIIALAYFKGDKKAARGIEKSLKKIGIPGGRRGGGQNVVKRGLLSWTLASIGDPKSGRFVDEELMAKLKNVRAFWVSALLDFYQAVAEKCEGDDAAMARIEEGLGGFVKFAKDGGLGRYGAETRGLMDAYRKGREGSGFKPLGDGLLGG